MPFPKRLLVPGEELVLDLRPHWIALVLPSLATIGVVIVGFWLISKFDGTVNWVVLVAMAIVLIAYPIRRLVWWLTSYFVVTSDAHREGVIATPWSPAGRSTMCGSTDRVRASARDAFSPIRGSRARGV
jgi:hypothetical protein